MNNPQIIKTLTSKKLNQPLTVKKGITDSQINQLIEYAHSDPAIELTNDPKRFASRADFDAWRKETAVFYTLVDDKDNLMGIIWFEPVTLKYEGKIERKNPEHYGITFAIRLYQEARGKGLSEPFTKVALEDFKKTREYLDNPNNGIWLGTFPENIPAKKSYLRSGFKEVFVRADGKRLIMILKDSL